MLNAAYPYRASTPWGPLAATAVSVGVLITSLLSIAIVVVGVALWLGISAGDTWLTLIATPIQQAMLVLLTWYAATRYGGQPREILALRAPAGGWKTYVVWFGLFVAGVAIMNVAVHLSGAGSNKEDLKPFEEMFKSSGWFVALLMVGVGAPLSEELLFRGFLFPAIAQRAGVIWATLVTSGIWASIHFYSTVGMIQVFVLGLLLSAILVRTGSLRVTIVVHGLYNTGLALLMMAGLGGWL